jgi:hydroxyacylglutathione hydrolase
LAALQANNLKLDAILLTHHPADHVGGVQTLLQNFDVPVYGPANEKIAGITNNLRQADQVELKAPHIRFSVIDVPGHTAGHIAYYAAEQDWLFCGDTLFAGGCGRLFEGTAAQMTASLAKLSALPDSTLVYCAHEYTLSNLRFALVAEPENSALQERFSVEEEKRAHGIATVPSLLGLEKSTNPFLRNQESSIIDQLIAQGRLHTRDPIEAFAALREWKNTFR